MAKTRRTLPSALGASIAIHAGLLTMALVWAGLRPEEVATKTPPIRTELVFLQHSGPGGGGGGNPAPAPPKPMEIPPHQMSAIPAVAVPAPIEPPAPTLDAFVQTNLANVLQASGTNLLALPGPGGGGRGSGVGSGDGPGVGPGTGGNTGGGPRRVGDGVTSPVPIRSVKPQYTNAAMQARISGTVTLEVVVRADGTVGDVRVIDSLDKVHGLDLEAIRTSRQWLFLPGMFDGKAVDVIVRIILEFNLR
jgi:protein TonB